MPENWNSRAFLPQRELQHRGNRLTLNPPPPADMDLDVPGRIPTDTGSHIRGTGDGDGGTAQCRGASVHSDREA